MSAAATATGAESLTFSIPANLIAMYQHEIGTDEIDGQDVLSISSSFETSELSLLVGGPSQQAREGQNRWLRLERIEPDFLQSGDMSVVVTARKKGDQRSVGIESEFFEKFIAADFRFHPIEKGMA